MTPTLAPVQALLETKCSNPKCGNVMFPGEEMHVDYLARAAYCAMCGTCLRYHRKKAAERGEAIPITFEQTELNHE